MHVVVIQSTSLHNCLWHVLSAVSPKSGAYESGALLTRIKFHFTLAGFLL